MKGEASPQNNLIADIYQSMLNGDHNALYKLQHINLKHPPRLVQHNSQQRTKTNTQEKQKNQWNQNQSLKDFTQKPSQNPSQNPSSKQQQSHMKQSKFITNMNKLKQEMYLNVLKKGPKLSNFLKNQNKIQYLRDKRWLNSSNGDHQNPSLAKISKKSLTKQKEATLQYSVENKHNISSQFASQQTNKIHVLPKVPKQKDLPKVQSANIQPRKITTTDLEAPKVLKKAKKAQKTQKIDFKEAVVMSKKQKFQLQKMNEQQLKLQLEIVEIHKQTKQKLQAARNKYELNFNNRNKYLRRKKKLEEPNQQMKQSQSTQKLSPFRLSYQSEKAKCQDLYAQVNHLKIQFNNNLGALGKFESAANVNIFVKWLQRHSDQIYQEDGEDQDTVQPLLTTQEKKDKYTKLMAHTKDKKWSLMQRTQYEAQRAQQLYQSRKTGISSRLQIGEEDNFHYQTSKQNKVTVNQRLRLLLFN